MEESSEAYKQGYDYFMTDSEDRFRDSSQDWHRGFRDALADWKLEHGIHTAFDPPLDLANNLY